jgi:hypothetical protein
MCGAQDAEVQCIEVGQPVEIAQASSSNSSGGVGDAWMPAPISPTRIDFAANGHSSATISHYRSELVFSACSTQLLMCLVKIVRALSASR